MEYGQLAEKHKLEIESARNYVLITDLDGTLLNSQKKISAEDKRALEMFVDAGGRFAVATGRSPYSAQDWLQQLPINFPCIFYNGSMVKDVQENRQICCDYLDNGQFAPLLEWILANSSGTVVEVFTESGLWVVSDPANKDPYLEQEKDPYVQSSLDQVRGQKWIKILLCDQHRSLECIEVQLKREGMEESCEYFYSQDFFLEITPPNCSKGTALAILKKEKGLLDCKMIAVGDYENDIEMIRRADIGIAMGNAKQEVKAVADYITVNNDEHPMAAIIGKIFR